MTEMDLAGMNNSVKGSRASAARWNIEQWLNIWAEIAGVPDKFNEAYRAIDNYTAVRLRRWGNGGAKDMFGAQCGGWDALTGDTDHG